MIAYKGFSSDLTAKRGKGIFQYEIGKTYENPNAKCARTGFHCVEEPIEVLSWYDNSSDRYCIVQAEGDIHEDGNNKIACTRITIVKEVSLLQLGILECHFLQKHPLRKYSSHICKEEGFCHKKGGIVIVRGRNPKAAGVKGAYLFLVKEKSKSEIENITVLEVDGEEIKADTYYRISGKEAR